MLNLFSRYISIGVINTALHWVCFGILLYFFGTTQAVGNLIAFSIAVTFSFFANAKWTFKSNPTSRRYIAFVTFMGVVAGLTGYIADIINAPKVVTLVVFSSFSLISGFIYSKFIIFRDAK
ncbi:TPA: GtrA family protein [Kluyvera intermedia]|uniref:Bactoprenol-linked glucose translocase n=2 Tax=Enterobacteriaceae TaxID=543 RepID=A0AAC8QKN9_9ENTR|nr:GtrA family protein [Phytobacter ursingii]HAT2206541.1 GtrA family protein [Kluyvera intermedia]AKL10529.1 translocase [Phytobacter ursingii]HAT2517264.1 GtrA family protein [Kluyvera intermedia]HAT2605265.1 GtrA family protein [Kluyvera intermedia]HAT2611558.1 GtrA family protein [Kluyvera intermedia]